MSGPAKRSTSQMPEGLSRSPNHPDDISHVATGLYQDKQASSGGDEVSRSSTIPSAIQLTERTPRKAMWPIIQLHFWHIPVLGLAYIAHARYRRLSPRRLPPLTPLKLPGIYGTFAVSQWIFNATHVQYLEIDVIPWLESVKAIREFNEILVRQYRDDRKGKLPKIDDIFGPGQATFWRLWEHRRYHDLDILGKLKWWHHHWRSDPDTRFFGYAQWASVCKDMSPVPWDDIDTCGTHFANAWCTTSESHVLIFDHIWHPIVGLLATAPIAILARYTQLRSLYLPINLLQRLLVGAIVYFGPVVWYEQQSILKNVEKRTRIAKAIPKQVRVLRPTFDGVDD